MTKKHAIVACCDTNYLPLACCALLSASRNTPARSTELFLIVATDRTADEGDVAQFESVHHVSFAKHFIRKESQSDVVRTYGPATLRLELDRILGPHHERVLYIDSDAIALSDLVPLLEASLHGKPSGAVRDLMRPWKGNYKRLEGLGLEFGKYFNSGVMLFDFKMCLEMGLFQAARTVTGKTKWPDQDALNIAFKGKWQSLPLEWNYTGAFHPRKNISPKIIHFTGGVKGSRPWKTGAVPMHQVHRQFYSDALAGTSWENFVEPNSRLDAFSGMRQLWWSNIRRSSTVSDYLKAHETEFGKRRA